eukprot:TRINITY_DN32557_c0_g1_i2.p1 TRINITY_DN32557_c0_g1~~TRINITY_DN32557_c0_g1_i2.p1  ORF type:complete len:118 (+),score=18.73 TRINITY_DN32557_c0_g1_i2:28-354(+)
MTFAVHWIATVMVALFASLFFASVAQQPQSDVVRNAPRTSLWNLDQALRQMDDLKSELVQLRTELKENQKVVQALGAETSNVSIKSDADHGRTLFLTMCAGQIYFNLY